jgi:hypothetical protein
MLVQPFQAGYVTADSHADSAAWPGFVAFWFSDFCNFLFFVLDEAYWDHELGLDVWTLIICT